VNEDARLRHAERLKALLPPFIERIDWSESQLKRERLRALREFLVTATERSPWHRQRLSHVDVRDLTPADMTELPVMTKADLMDNFDDIVTDERLSRALCERHLETGASYLLDAYKVVASGGSSGTRGVYVYGWDAWAALFASIERFPIRDWTADPSLAHVDRVIAVVAASQPTHISAAVGRTFSTPDSPRHLFGVSRPLHETVEGLNELQPSVLMGYSSFLVHLAAEAEAGRLHIRPRRIAAISEPLLPESRAKLSGVWDAPVSSGYGMSEGIFTGSCGSALHLPDDLTVVEPVDSDGRPIGPGTPSHRIYITNLYNDALPLIRFEVPDEITVLDTKCPCGSAFTVIADPQGRLDDVFVYREGLHVHPHVFRSVLGSRPEITEYQVLQTPHGADIRVVAQSGTDTDLIERRIEAALLVVGLRNPAVTVSVVPSLDRLASGKLKRFIPAS
jgi:phenylacetate-coenzyme A ligase PaaK-like adenylate-forming protein